MRPPIPCNFLEADLTGSVTSKATPPAQVSLLATADRWPVDVATTPYVGCGHIFDGCSGANYYPRYLAAIVAPGAQHGRAAISRGFQLVVNSSGATNYHELWSSDGGTSGNDVIHTPAHLVQSLNYLPEFYFQFALHSIAVSGDSIVDAPTNNIDRQLELQTLGYPYVESLYVTQAAGFSLCITDQVADLESL